MPIYKHIKEILSDKKIGDDCSISGRISRIHITKNFAFLDLTDSSKTIQVVVSKTDFLNEFEELKKLKKGSYLSVQGVLNLNEKNQMPEIHLSNLEIIASANTILTPFPDDINGLDEKYRNQVLGFPHSYHINPQRVAIAKFYGTLRREFSKYFDERGFLQIIPPIITDTPLYGIDTCIQANVNDEDVILTQCSTYTLEAMALAHGKVYTISPAFRNESAGTKRHLNEYWHLKAESLFANIDDLMNLASECIYTAVLATVNLCEEELSILEANIDLEKINPKNQERITYIEALKLVQKKGSETKFGVDLNMTDEEILTSYMGNKYVWITHKPRSSEGFPYRIDPNNNLLSLTGDLIAPHKSGEMVGIAEKIHDPEELIIRMKEKGLDPHDYAQYILLRHTAMPPHGGIGAAPERIAYGLLDLPHIAYIMPRPIYPGRRVKMGSDLNPTNEPGINDILDKHGLSKNL